MPELPEVETIRLGLQKYLVGRVVEDVEVRLSKILSGDPKNIIGAKVKDVKRFGKGIVIDLDNNYSLAVHLKLTGQLIYRNTTTRLKLSPKVGGELPNKFTHVIFKLKAKSEKRKTDSYLYYNDLRQFGWIKIIKTNDVKNLPFFKELGPEPPVASAVGGQAFLTLNKFRELVGKTKLPIKILLMDQKRIGGIGNIYSNEALFEAGIDPRKASDKLSDVEIKKIYDSLIKVLKKGLEKNGASDVNFVNVLGQEGKYQDYFLAYGQQGKKCKRCGETIKKISLGGRGTYFCPSCQK